MVLYGKEKARNGGNRPWSRCRDSNPGPHAPKARALPTGLHLEICRGAGSSWRIESAWGFPAPQTPTRIALELLQQSGFYRVPDIFVQKGMKRMTGVPLPLAPGVGVEPTLPDMRPAGQRGGDPGIYCPGVTVYPQAIELSWPVWRPWWALWDSNPGQPGYEPGGLTN